MDQTWTVEILPTNHYSETISSNVRILFEWSSLLHCTSGNHLLTCNIELLQVQIYFVHVSVLKKTNLPKQTLNNYTMSYSVYTYVFSSAYSSCCLHPDSLSFSQNFKAMSACYILTGFLFFRCQKKREWIIISIMSRQATVQISTVTIYITVRIIRNSLWIPLLIIAPCLCGDVSL